MGYSTQIFPLVLLIAISVSHGLFRHNVCRPGSEKKVRQSTKLDITTVSSESYSFRYSAKNMVYTVQSSKVKYWALRERGVIFSSKDDSDVVKFQLRIRGVPSVSLSSMDASIECLLNCDQAEEYRKFKLSFADGLNVPFLRFVGASLDSSVNREDMQKRAMTVPNYRAVARAAQKVIDSVQEQWVEITGSIKVTSLVSSRVSANVYIKYAEVTTSDGSTKNVISTNPMDLVVACEEGHTESFHGTDARLYVDVA